MFSGLLLSYLTFNNLFRLRFMQFEPQFTSGRMVLFTVLLVMVAIAGGAISLCFVVVCIGCCYLKRYICPHFRTFSVNQFIQWQYFICWFMPMMIRMTEINKWYDTIFYVYTPWAIKTCHFVFDNNSGVSCSIFILFCTSRKGKKYSTIYLFNGLMTS